MSLHTNFERLIRIDSLINKKATGNTANLAIKLDLSKSGTEKFIREMKEEGIPISYCKKSKSYIYTRPGRIIGKLFIEE